MARSYRPNPRFEKDAAESPITRRALGQVAAQLANDAQAVGRQVAPSYEATVADGRFTGVETGSVQVRADTKQIGAAGWIEFGTPDLPPLAPLRSAVEAAGLRLED